MTRYHRVSAEHFNTLKLKPDARDGSEDQTLLGKSEMCTSRHFFLVEGSLRRPPVLSCELGWSTNVGWCSLMEGDVVNNVMGSHIINRASLMSVKKEKKADLILTDATQLI